LRLVQDRSPAGITTTDLAQALGRSQGALFKHFPTKEAIWLGVMASVTEHLLRLLQHDQVASMREQAPPFFQLYLRSIRPAP
jgi:AcrR family transcriptional regulator